jgi:hypothetical protein
MAVADSVADGTIPADQADDLFICVGVFIHWEANDDKKIQDFNSATEAIARAMKGDPSARSVLSACVTAEHPSPPTELAVRFSGASGLFVLRWTDRVGASQSASCSAVATAPAAPIASAVQDRLRRERRRPHRRADRRARDDLRDARKSDLRRRRRASASRR